MQRLASVSIVAIALSLVTAAPAFAQAPRAQTWTGFYIGAHIGSGFNTPEFEVTEQGPFIYNDSNTLSSSMSAGVVFGGQAGYNFTFLGRIVAGGEFAFGSQGYSGDLTDGPNGDTLLETTGGAYWTALGRVGYLITPSTLAYFSLGAIGVTNHARVLDDCSVSPCGPLTMDIDESGMADEFIWGFGFEYRPGSVLMKKHWSIKGEALFSDFSSQILAEDPDGDYSWLFRTHFPKTMVRGSFNIYF